MNNSTNDIIEMGDCEVRKYWLGHIGKINKKKVHKSNIH